MTEVELDTKKLKRILGILNAYFSDNKPTKEDKALLKFIEVMYEAEKEWDEAEKDED